jgi:hypothetical protein
MILDNSGVSEPEIQNDTDIVNPQDFENNYEKRFGMFEPPAIEILATQHEGDSELAPEPDLKVIRETNEDSARALLDMFDTLHAALYNWIAKGESYEKYTSKESEKAKIANLINGYLPDDRIVMPQWFALATQVVNIYGLKWFDIGNERAKNEAERREKEANKRLEMERQKVKDYETQLKMKDLQLKEMRQQQKREQILGTNQTTETQPVTETENL